MNSIAAAYTKSLPPHPQDALAAPNGSWLHSQLTLVGSATPSEDGKTGKDYVEWEKAQAQELEHCEATITMRPLHPISGAQLPMTERTQQRLPSLPSRVSSSSIVHPGSPPTTSASKSEHEAFPNPHTNAHPPPSSKHRGHPSILHAVKSITIRNPFRSAGSQRSPIITDLFRDAVATPDLNVGSVSTFVPRITKPIAPVRGFPQRADVVEHCRISADCTVQGRRNPHRGSKTLDCADIRRTQDGDVDGLFFASRCRGSGPKVVHAKTNKGPSKEGGCSRPSTGQSQRKKPPADFLNVTIPNPSIALFDDIL